MSKGKHSVVDTGSSDPKATRLRSLDEDLPELRPYLNSGAKVLDIGCAFGTMALDVADVVNPGEVIGIDLSDERIAYASSLAEKRNGNSVTFKVVSDAHRLDFPDNTFDVVYSYTVMHFFIDPVRALSEQRRVTKPGGYVIAAGVRDWGTSPIYPPCPMRIKITEALASFFESRA